ncbi:MAG: hypothetical protein ACJASL_001947 [Paraglaciecola sp.]
MKKWSTLLEVNYSVNLMSGFKRFFGDIRNQSYIHTNGKNSVLWLSHHIPKTAGTSLREGYVGAFGQRSIKNMYSPDEVRVVSNGGAISLPAKTVILHGHFRAHPDQLQFYPNAKRIVWVRDPVERAWSLLGHLLAVQQFKKEYKIIYKEFDGRIEQNKLEVFKFFLTHPQLKKMNRPYRYHFSAVPISDFHFIGSTNNYAQDLLKLSDFMGTEINLFQKNIRVSSQSLPKNRGPYESMLKEEYDIVANYL